MEEKRGFLQAFHALNDALIVIKVNTYLVFISSRSRKQFINFAKFNSAVS